MSKLVEVVARIAVYTGEGEVFRYPANMSVLAVSRTYPLYENGEDVLLSDIPAAARDRATIVFYDKNGNELPDPRVIWEDII